MSTRDTSVAEGVMVVAADVPPGYLVDAMLAEVLRAEAVLLLISGQFSGADEGDWSDQVMSSAVWAAQGHLGMLKTLINHGYKTSRSACRATTTAAVEKKESP
ncbi:hypothetical protein [Pseudomonas huanghezhanensis]|uniref:hypothetical protein n=1 Tax=Pseudomonas huanghezhanensis TaxID=3002903 RepID=UPI002286A1FD|nr:hypothetical protein [Pseudomonas sp. BSw22131]